MREDDYRIADAYACGFGPAEAGRSDVGQQHHLLVCEAVGNLGEVGLRVRHQQVLGLRAVDRVAKAPAADGLVAAAVAALRQVAGQAGAALAARRDCADQHAVADLIAGDTEAEFFDDADRLVADDQAGAHGILAAHDVQVSAADGRQGDADHGFADARARLFNFFDAKVIHAMKHVRSHLVHMISLTNNLMGKPYSVCYESSDIAIALIFVGQELTSGQGCEDSHNGVGDFSQQGLLSQSRNRRINHLDQHVGSVAERVEVLGKRHCAARARCVVSNSFGPKVASRLSARFFSSGENPMLTGQAKKHRVRPLLERLG